MKVMHDTIYFKYFVVCLILDNNANGIPIIPLMAVILIVLPIPNKIKKYIIVSKLTIVEAVNATRLPLPAIP